MNSIRERVACLRRLIIASPLSMREIARIAGLGSDHTIRKIRNRDNLEGLALGTFIKLDDASDRLALAAAVAACDPDGTGRAA